MAKQTLPLLIGIPQVTSLTSKGAASVKHWQNRSINSGWVGNYLIQRQLIGKKRVLPRKLLDADKTIWLINHPIAQALPRLFIKIALWG